MTNQTYTIFLDNKKIGTTNFEYVDAPMGVVFGKINFIESHFGYDFIKNYCDENNIKYTDYQEDKIIATMHIPNLRTTNIKEVEIIGLGCSIEGMDNEGFRIAILGIDFLLYQHEFPQYTKITLC